MGFRKICFIDDRGAGTCDKEDENCTSCDFRKDHINDKSLSYTAWNPSEVSETRLFMIEYWDYEGEHEEVIISKNVTHEEFERDLNEAIQYVSKLDETEYNDNEPFYWCKGKIFEVVCDYLISMGYKSVTMSSGDTIVLDTEYCIDTESNSITVRKTTKFTEREDVLFSNYTGKEKYSRYEYDLWKDYIVISEPI